MFWTVVGALVFVSVLPFILSILIVASTVVIGILKIIITGIIEKVKK